MPDAETLTLPRDLVERAVNLGDRHVAAVEELRETVETYRAEVRPIVEAYGLELAARAKARAEADAERLESRNAFARLASSRPAMALYGIVLSALATYIMGSAGIAPAEIRAALTPEATDVAPQP